MKILINFKTYKEKKAGLQCAIVTNNEGKKLKHFFSTEKKAVEIAEEWINNNANEVLFDAFENSRSLKDLQPLYNNGIFLHEISGNGTTTEKRSLLNTEGKKLVKAYDLINGKMIFNKILVY